MLLEAQRRLGNPYMEMNIFILIKGEARAHTRLLSVKKTLKSGLNLVKSRILVLRLP